MIYLIAALACYRITRLLVEDSITDPLRTWAEVKAPFLSRMLDCYFCAGFWVAVVVTLALPTTGAVDLPPLGWLLLPFAFSAVTGILSRSD